MAEKAQAPGTKPTINEQDIPPRDTALNLHQRLLLVMHRVGYIPKTGTGPESQGSYAFARVEVIRDTVREQLVAVGVMCYASMVGRDIQVFDGTGSDGRGKRTILATVWGTMTFINVDNPDERWTVDIHGQGTDSQDKAVSKATTSAEKYGLLTAFQIPTGKDPDETGESLPSGGGQSRSTTGNARRPQRPSQDATDADGVPWPDEGQSQRRGDYSGAAAAAAGGMCPDHNRAWRAGRNGGWFCSAKDDRTESGYCGNRPTKEWADSQKAGAADRER